MNQIRMQYLEIASCRSGCRCGFSCHCCDNYPTTKTGCHLLVY
jgi:hypothetical protein